MTMRVADLIDALLDAPSNAEIIVAYDDSHTVGLTVVVLRDGLVWLGDTDVPLYDENDNPVEILRGPEGYGPD